MSSLSVPLPSDDLGRYGVSQNNRRSIGVQLVLIGDGKHNWLKKSGSSENQARIIMEKTENHGSIAKNGRGVIIEEKNSLIQKDSDELENRS